MRIKAFTLIELIIVIILFGVSSYLVLSNVKKVTTPILTSDKIIENYKDITIYMLRDKIISTKKISLKLTNPIIYDKNLKEIEFKRYEDKDVIFKYILKNGIQNSYILECNEGIFVFKPFETIKVSSLDEAQEILTYQEYAPQEGNYYK